MEDDIINIYFFYGKVCFHCAEKEELFDSVKEECKVKFAFVPNN